MRKTNPTLLIASFLLTAAMLNGQDHCPESKEPQAVTALQSRVKALQDELTAAKAAEPGAAESASMRKAQERLLLAMEELECQQESSISVQKGILSTSTFVQVPLLYVTDRQRAAPPKADAFYTSATTGGLEFGRVNAIINEIGSIRTGLISGAKRVSAPTAMGKAQVQAFQPLSEKALKDMMIAPRPTPREPVRVLLFVHGFNVQFYEAALSLARLATSMQVSLVPVFYSWPSQGDVIGYWHDEDEVAAAAVRFTPFLERLLSGPADEVIIVCHSMGARIVTRALGELARKNAKLSSLKKVVYAAADINIEEFNAQWPSLQKIQGTEWTLYESSGDFALRLSTFIHSFRRVGESDGGVYVQDGIDTIDASSTTSIFRTLGHSYIVSSPALAADVGDWVAQDLPPGVRGLGRLMQGKAVYWRFP
jgi:esterase/lipase superfamily enzyme